jgi:hypothetical protein
MLLVTPAAISASHRLTEAASLAASLFSKVRWCGDFDNDIARSDAIEMGSAHIVVVCIPDYSGGITRSSSSRMSVSCAGDRLSGRGRQELLYFPDKTLLERAALPRRWILSDAGHRISPHAQNGLVTVYKKHP